MTDNDTGPVFGGRRITDVHPDVDRRAGRPLRVLRHSKQRAIERLSAFGHAPLCNLRPERAFHVRSFVFPLCARCAGLLAGALASGAAAGGFVVTMTISAAAIVSAPLLIDWLLQRL